jgi:hypothetical protein
MSENSEETPSTPTTPPPQKIAIDIPKDVPTFYANLAFISHTPAEIVLDFAQMLPRMPRGTVKARVIMSPMHAKLLHKALGQNVANFERQFGEIRMPNTIADQFFRFPQQGPEDK